MAESPFGSLPRADERIDTRRKRRALTEDELVRLLDAARERPLYDALLIRRGKHKGELRANLKPETRRRLEQLGHERALIYKTYLLTGLRKSELASLTVVQLGLGGPLPLLRLDAPDEKSREGSSIPLRHDLAAELAEWLAHKLATLQAECRSRGEPMPMTLPPHTPVFDVPDGLLRILDRDLKFAGIDKQDARSRSVDIHALRHSFGTHLSRAGVAPRTAQAAMRHCKIDLTMNVYTDPKLLDVASAVESLPPLPIDGDSPGTDSHQIHHLKVVGCKCPQVSTCGDVG